jgi:hypothetical protein
MGEMKRRDAYESDQIKGSRYVSTLVIASAIKAIEGRTRPVKAANAHTLRRFLRVGIVVFMAKRVLGCKRERRTGGAGASQPRIQSFGAAWRMTQNVASGGEHSS